MGSIPQLVFHLPAWETTGNEAGYHTAEENLLAPGAADLLQCLRLPYMNKYVAAFGIIGLLLTLDLLLNRNSNSWIGRALQSIGVLDKKSGGKDSQGAKHKGSGSSKSSWNFWDGGSNKKKR